MKFKMSSNSQRALIITLLLMSISAALLFQVKLSSVIAKHREELYELKLEDIEEEIEEFMEKAAKAEIETHKAFNEAEEWKTSGITSSKSEYEKFIEELEQEREDEQLMAMNLANDNNN